MTYANLTNATGFTDIMIYSNTATNGAFGLVIVICMFVVAFIAMKNYTTERALASASFVTAILAILLRFIGLITNTVMVPIIVLGCLSVIWLIGQE